MARDMPDKDLRYVLIGRVNDAGGVRSKLRHETVSKDLS
jgi:hypothetical protein